MAIDLKALQPHKVSKDLSGYITYIYGPGGAGKTTFGSQAPKPLLIAFEKGYNALPGVIAQDVTTWGEMKQVLKQLDDPEIQDMFKTIIIDTADIAAQLCEKYMCNKLGVENIGDGGWSVNGWSKVKKEWEETFRAITMKNYALIFISHAKDKKTVKKDGTEYNQVIPSCSTAYNEIIKNMADIEGYIDIANGTRTLVLRSPDDSVECKCRFAEISPSIPFSYNSLIEALNEAIDKEGKANGNKFVTTEKEKPVAVTTYNFDEVRDEFNTIVGELMGKSQDNAVKIQSVVNKYLGKGKKVSEATPEQAELIFLINKDLKEDYLNK